jgi:hypothetical protein
VGAKAIQRVTLILVEIVGSLIDLVGRLDTRADRRHLHRRPAPLISQPEHHDDRVRHCENAEADSETVQHPRPKSHSRSRRVIYDDGCSDGDERGEQQEAEDRMGLPPPSAHVAKAASGTRRMIDLKADAFQRFGPTKRTSSATSALRDVDRLVAGRGATHAEQFAGSAEDRPDFAAGRDVPGPASIARATRRSVAHVSCRDRAGRSGRLLVARGATPRSEATSSDRRAMVGLPPALAPSPATTIGPVS